MQSCVYCLILIFGRGGGLVSHLFLFLMFLIGHALSFGWVCSFPCVTILAGSTVAAPLLSSKNKSRYVVHTHKFSGSFYVVIGCIALQHDKSIYVCGRIRMWRATPHPSPRLLAVSVCNKGSRHLLSSPLARTGIKFITRENGGGFGID